MPSTWIVGTGQPPRCGWIPRHSCSCHRRTKADFGWDASVPLDEGIAKAVEWYEQNAVGETYTHLKADEVKVRAESG